MDNKKKNIEVLKLTFYICCIFVVVIAGGTFIHFKDGFYKEWLTIMVGLIGSVFGGFLTVYGVILTLNRTLDMVTDAEKKENCKREAERLETVNGVKFIIYSELKAYLNSIDNELVYIIEVLKQEQFDLPNYKSVRGLYKLDDDFKKYVHKLISLGEIEQGDVLLKFYDKYSNITKNLEDKNISDKHQILFAIIKDIGEKDEYLKVASYTLYEAREAPGTVLQFSTNPASHREVLEKFLEEHKHGKYSEFKFLNNKFKKLMEYLHEGMQG